jgi:hypothetical protein
MPAGDAGLPGVYDSTFNQLQILKGTDINAQATGNAK